MNIHCGLLTLFYFHLESVNFLELKSQMSSLEAKYVRMHKRLEAVEKNQKRQNNFNNGK